jgi:O-acetyl-ADP-ribose deacetylase
VSEAQRLSRRRREDHAGFNLPAKYVIHTVGPVWNGGRNGEPALLASCYRRSLELAAEHGCKSVAFPAISCGLYGYPIEQACEIAVREVRGFLAEHDTPERVILVAFGDEIHDAYQRLLGGASK